jgi:hypothetical protein
MNITNCPICFEELDVIETTPCMCCGNSEDKISLLKKDIDEGFIHDTNTFSIYRAFENIECVLCDICTFEFSTIKPEFFGFPKNKTIWPDNFQYLKSIEPPSIVKDKFCKSCYMRLSFINFTLKLRSINGA